MRTVGDDAGDVARLLRRSGPYHAGFLVDSIDEVVRQWQLMFGHVWGPVIDRRIEVHAQAGARTISVRLARSGDADGFVELLEGGDGTVGTVWAADRSADAKSGHLIVHHLGYWSDDVPRDLDTVTSELGGVVEATDRQRDGSFHRFAFCRFDSGLRIELAWVGLAPRGAPTPS